MKIEINNQTVEVKGTETLIETASRIGVHIPSLCYAAEVEHKASCMVCAVSCGGQIIPSCSTEPIDGMVIETDTQELRNLRRMSLELLLSDHRAECEARCRVACPAGFDVAQMNRLYDTRRYDQALEHLRNGLVIPATLCYVCPAPCEKICRRADIADAVTIREIKKELVAMTDLTKISKAEPNGKRAAVTGSDPGALSAAYTLARLGYQTVVFEEGAVPLTPYIGEVPAEIVELELSAIRAAGVEIRTNSTAETCDVNIRIETKIKQPARLIAIGRTAALRAIDPTYMEPVEFNSSYSKFTEQEKTNIKLPNNESGCLYCDCDKKRTCRLRDAATEYGIKSSRYTPSYTREAMQRQNVGNSMMFESAKCVSCGLCVYNSSNGFTFEGRGFPMQVILPEPNIDNVSERLAAICPTGALYIR